MMEGWYSHGLGGHCGVRGHPHPGYPDLVLALRQGWGKQTGAMPLSPEHFGSCNLRRGYLFVSARGSRTSPYFLLQSPSPYIPLPHQQLHLAKDTLPTMIRNHTASWKGAFKTTGLALSSSAFPHRGHYFPLPSHAHCFPGRAYPKTPILYNLTVRNMRDTSPQSGTGRGLWLTVYPDPQN